MKVQADTLGVEPLLPGFGYRATLRHHGDGLLSDVDYGQVVNRVMVRDADGAAVGLETGGDDLERTSAVAAVLPLASVLVSLVRLLTTPFGRRASLRNRWLRRLPALTLLSLVLGILCTANLERALLAQRNWQTVGVWAAPVLLPAFGAAGLVLSVRTWREETAALAKWRCSGPRPPCASAPGWRRSVCSRSPCSGGDAGRQVRRAIRSSEARRPRCWSNGRGQRTAS